MRVSIKLFNFGSVFYFVIGMMFAIFAGADWFDTLFDETNTNNDNLDHRYKTGIGFLFLSIVLFIISLVFFI